MEQVNFDLQGGFKPTLLKWNETITFPSTKKLTEYGNKIYNRYPARSIFLVPRATIYSKVKISKKKLNIMDPFMGSGTTAVEASLQSCNIYGVEMDPFARLIAEVSIIRFTKEEAKEVEECFNSIIKNWNECEIDKKLIPKLKNIEYWFDKKNFEDLLKLKTYIFNEIENEKYLKYFKIVFADCIKPASKMERQSLKPYISSKYAKKIKPVMESFEYSYKKHIAATLQYGYTKTKKNYKINWVGNNATAFGGVKNKIDLAITSPPYLKAFDYTHIIKTESSWLGFADNENIGELRGLQVGHENRRNFEIQFEVLDIFRPYYQKIKKNNEGAKSVKASNTALSYFNDIFSNLKCVYNALKKGGEYHMVIGDSIVNGVAIPTHKVIVKLAELLNYEWVGYYKYPIKDHRTSIPRNGNGGKINYEYVVVLKK
ncbi:site-specific DNA-methyltransferase [bacterium]|nr:site-specific DNA-methyltransferase [bacterium]